MCLYSKLIPNPKYKPNGKNGGHVPPLIDIRAAYVPIGCKKCIECKNDEARKWQLRLTEDIKENTNGKFITLTFNNESIQELSEIIISNAKEKIDEIRNGKLWNDNTRKEVKKLELIQGGYELDNEIATLAMHRFRERWRKENKKSPRHWTTTELGHGETEHIHLHGIIWTGESKPKQEDFEKIANTWKYGYIWPRPDDKRQIKKNYVNGKTVNYIMKYVSKVDFEHKEYNPIVLTSPGIGANYTNSYNAGRNKYNGKNTDETYRTKNGYKMKMPIYWRNKIWSEEEREKLWLYKLDKQERYICGEKVSIKNGYEEYWKLIEYHRKRNQTLGYGDGSINQNKIEYERQIRLINQEKRIKKN